MKKKFEYGYWCCKDGSSYWGVRFPNTVPVTKLVHAMPKSFKARLLGWRFA